MNRNLIVGFAALALVLSANAVAGNNNGPIFGDEVTNNYNTTNNQGGQGGNATAGAAAGAAAGAISGSYSGVGDVTSVSHGGNATQGQGQQQSNVGINGQMQGQSSTNVLGQAQNTDASSANANDNRSSANGNATTVGGQTVNLSSTYVQKRNAPSISGGTVFPTASCKGGFGIGGSGPAGGGLLNIATTDKECQTILLGDHFAAIGMPETACDLYKVTKTWERALKKNPNIRAVCDAVVTPAAAPAAPSANAEHAPKYKYHTVIEGGKKQ